MSPLVLDVYDDVTGSVLREIFPTYASAPTLIKQAHQLTHEESNRLPDDTFGLVLVENGQKMRKYACIDAGNTALHMLYFLKVAHQLPEEAQKVASARLYHAYEMYKEAMRKEAFLAGIASAVGNAALSGAGKVIQNAAANPIRAIGLANSARPVGGISQNLAHARAQGGVIGGGHNQNFGGGGTP